LDDATLADNVLDRMVRVVYRLVFDGEFLRKLAKTKSTVQKPPQEMPRERHPN